MTEAFYTSLGRYVMRTDEYGYEYPVVISNENEHILTAEEFMVWMTFLWNIYQPDEVEAAYVRDMTSTGIHPANCFCDIFERLEVRGLIACGQGITKVDALYDLLAGLTVISCVPSGRSKIKAAFYLLFRRVPLRRVVAVFKKQFLTTEESSTLQYIKGAAMTTKALIQTVEVDTLDCEVPCGKAPEKPHLPPASWPVLQIVANLYLKKCIVLDKFVLRQQALP